MKPQPRVQARNAELIVKELCEDEFKIYQDRIAGLQSHFSSPMGDDYFYFDHGSDYFSWFRSMGKLYYFVVLEGETVVAVAASTIRQLTSPSGEKSDPFFYLCDLKVLPSHQGQKIPEKMFTNRFPHHYFRCPRGYAISIDPVDGSDNSIVKMLDNFPFIPFTLASRLGIIALDAELMEEVDPILRRHRGPVYYNSLAGVRDMILHSTGQPLPALHAQFGPFSQQGYEDPVEGHVHMFCAPLDDPLMRDLEIRGIRPTATASVVHHRMDDWKWQFLLTSEL